MPLSRRLFVGGSLTAAIGAAASAGVVSLASAQAPTGRKRTNILFLAIDDLRPGSLGAYGNRLVKTPNVDRLAASGAVFERAYVSQAVCGASRASLMTGLRPDSTGIHDYFGFVSKSAPDALTLNRAFKNAGWKTQSIGKVYHEWGDDPDGWTEPYYDSLEYQPRRRSQAITPENYLAMIEAREKYGKGRLPPPFEDVATDDGAYEDGTNTDFAIQELHRYRRSGDPFFLAVGLRKPHLPFYAPKKYWDLYDRADFDPPSNGGAIVGSPAWANSNFDELRHYATMPQGKEPLPPALLRRLAHGYHACVSYMDANVGRMLAALAATGLAEDTVVVLWGDHGYKLGEHASFAKHTNYEIDLHVPLIFAGQGIPTGERIRPFVETVDIFPTLAELAGVPASERREGTSFVPLIREPGRPWKQAAFSQYPRGGTPRGDLMGYTLRTDQYRYIAWVDRKSGALRAQELFDHKIDPGETRNVAGDRRYARALKRLEALRQRGWRGVQAELSPAIPRR